MELYEALSKVQRELKAPKTQYNKFGNFSYRSCEDILEAVKPLLPDGYCILLSDKVESINGRFYTKATASFKSKSASVECTAYARESETKKGMSPEQISGSGSSYARKYALSGLLGLSDGKDPDSDEPTKREEASLNATGKQLNAIRSIAAKKHGLIESDINNMCQSIWGCGFKDITMTQASSLIEDFDAKLKEFTTLQA
jgi:hypothetical protein